MFYGGFDGAGHMFLRLDNYLYRIFFVREKGEKMLRKIIFLVSLLVLVFGVTAEESVFDFFKPGVIFDFEKVMEGEKEMVVSGIFSSLQEPLEEIEGLIRQENVIVITSGGEDEEVMELNMGSAELLVEESEVVQIMITKKGFDPAEVKIEPGQAVMWVNERERLDALVVIVKGMPNEVSELLKPFEYFTWEFPEPGEYIYVGGVIIGQMGKVVVE